MMRVSKLMIVSGVWLTGAMACPTWAQQAPAQPSAPLVRGTSVPPPASFQLKQEDMNLARDVSRALAAGNRDQVQKLVTNGHLSIPQLERVVAAICDLSAERRLATAEGLPGARTENPTEVNLPDRQNLQSELVSRINAEFGGRGKNYQDASALVSRQLPVANEVCAFPALHAQGGR
jgi:hypothetical protein